MRRWLLSGGLSAILIGVGLIAPTIFVLFAQSPWTSLASSVLAFAVGLIICGAAAMAVGACQSRGPTMPSPVRMAATANMLFLAFFALEISDGLVRRGGAIHPLSSTMFAPALVLLYGLVSARRWAWWLARGVSAAGSLWFLGFAVAIPFVELRGPQGPVPWWGRLYMIGVSLTLAGILGSGCWSLGQETARSYFELLPRSGRRGQTRSHKIVRPET